MRLLRLSSAYICIPFDKFNYAITLCCIFMRVKRRDNNCCHQYNEIVSTPLSLSQRLAKLQGPTPLRQSCKPAQHVAHPPAHPPFAQPSTHTRIVFFSHGKNRTHSCAAGVATNAIKSIYALLPFKLSAGCCCIASNIHKWPLSLSFSLAVHVYMRWVLLITILQSSFDHFSNWSLARHQNMPLLTIEFSGWIFVSRNEYFTGDFSWK